MSGPLILPPKRRYRRIIALAAVIAAVMAYLLSRYQGQIGLEWQRFVSVVGRLEAGWLLIACVFALLTYVGRALRWAVLIRPVQPHPRLWNLFSATAIGFTAIVLLGRPGELVRPYLIAVKERVSFTSQIAAWMIERIYDLLIALLLFGIGLNHIRASRATLGPSFSRILAVGGGIVWVTCALCFTVLLLLRRYSRPMRQRMIDALGFLKERHLARAERIVTAFVQGVESTNSDLANLLLVAYTLLEWLLIGACYYSIIKAYGGLLRFTAVDIFIFMGFVSVGAVVQIPGVGGGVQVVAVAVLTELFGLPLGTAGSFAVVVWGITFAVIVPFGLILGLREGWRWKDFKSLDSEAGL